MKVHIINLYLSRKGGGIFTVIKELYNSNTSKFFFKSNLFFLGFRDEDAQKDSQMLNGVVSLFTKENPFFYSSKLGNKLRELNKAENIIHLNSLWMYPSLALVLFGKKKKRFKKIISPHGMLDSWAMANGRLKKLFFLNLVEKRNLRTANCIHALNYKEYLDVRRLAKKTPVAIIPNGINLPKIDKKIEKKKSILFLGRLHPKKGLDNLLAAWKFINSKGWNLIIVGPDEGNYTEKIRQMNEEMEPQGKRIDLIKGAFGKEKATLYNESSIFILPSFSEGLPMTVLEAWSYGLPVLMTKECNLDIGFKENAAVEIDASIISIKNGIQKLIDLPNSELVRIGSNGYNLVRREFTWDDVSQKMIETYKWVLGEVDRPDFIYLD